MGNSIADIVKAHLAAGKTQLPVFDEVSSKIQSMLKAEEFDIGEVEGLIEQDPVLASHLLRCANSAMFGGLEKIVTVREAIMRLGARQVAQMVVMVNQKQNFEARSPLVRSLMPTLWRHSVGAAFGCQWLARRCRLEEVASEAFLAGLLHDVGKLFLLRVVDDLKSQGGGQFDPAEALVLELLDAMHAEQGHALLQKWGIPEPYTEVARRHHDEDLEGGDVLISVVRLVDATCKKLGLGLVRDDGIILAALPEAESLGASEMVLAELEVALEDAMDLA